MYKVVVKVDGGTTYNSLYNTNDFTSAKVTCEMNSSNSFEFTARKGCLTYDTIEKSGMLKAVVSVYVNDNLIFEGRPIKRAVDFYNNVTISCEGVLAYLYDTVQPPKDYTGKSVEEIFKGILETHNSQCDDSHKFTAGTVNVVDTTEGDTDSNTAKTSTDDPTSEDDDPSYIYQYADGTTDETLKTDYNTSWDALNNLLISRLSGYVYLRKSTDGGYVLDYLKDYQGECAQQVNFGENLLDYSSSMDYSSICSGVLALGTTKESSESDSDTYTTTDSDTKLTIDSTEYPDHIVWNSNAVSTFGKIVKVVEWSKVKTQEKLAEKATKYLTVGQYNNLSLECKVMDLNVLDSTKEQFKLMQLVRVISKPHAVNRRFPITKMEYDLINPGNNTLTLGKTDNTASQIMQQTAYDSQLAGNTLTNVTSTININAAVGNEHNNDTPSFATDDEASSVAST